jgi:DNA-binding transcriptional MocR family regulator
LDDSAKSPGSDGTGIRQTGWLDPHLIGWARRRGAVIIEDDYDSEYRYSGAPMPALQGLASGVPIVHVLEGDVSGVAGRLFGRTAIIGRCFRGSRGHARVCAIRRS